MRRKNRIIFLTLIRMLYRDRDRDREMSVRIHQWKLSQGHVVASSLRKVSMLLLPLSTISHSSARWTSRKSIPVTHSQARTIPSISIYTTTNRLSNAFFNCRENRRRRHCRVNRLRHLVFHIFFYLISNWFDLFSRFLIFAPFSYIIWQR